MKSKYHYTLCIGHDCSIPNQSCSLDICESHFYMNESGVKVADKSSQMNTWILLLKKVGARDSNINSEKLCDYSRKTYNLFWRAN